MCPMPGILRTKASATGSWPWAGEHAFHADHNIRAIRRNQCQKSFCSRVNVLVQSTLRPGSMMQTYIERACKSIPHSNDGLRCRIAFEASFAIDMRIT
jgi:hypothetical protein